MLLIEGALLEGSQTLAGGFGLMGVLLFRLGELRCHCCSRSPKPSLLVSYSLLGSAICYLMLLGNSSIPT